MHISQLGSFFRRKKTAALPKLQRWFRMSIRRANAEPAEDTNTFINFIPEHEPAAAPATPGALDQDVAIQEDFPVVLGSLTKSLCGIPLN